MAKFYETFPDFVKSPLYIFGESYSGHYIPAFASQLLEDERLTSVNYQGVGIGDGLTDAAF